VDANTGVFTMAGSGGVTITKGYAINQIPLWYAAGSVIPYVPLRMMTTPIGNAGRQYTALGFKIVPGGSSGRVKVYEDDGTTTNYLTKNEYAYTTCEYSTMGDTLSINVSSDSSFPEMPSTRVYQFRLLNSKPILSVTLDGDSIDYNRFGKIASTGRFPSQNQHYYDFSLLPDGMGVVIDVVNVMVSKPITVKVTFVPQPIVMNGVYGAITHALWAKANLDIERTTPGSNVVEPASTSVLASMGQALEYLSMTNVNQFQAAVGNVPSLLGKAVSELGKLSSPRKGYSVELLLSANK